LNSRPGNVDPAHYLLEKLSYSEEALEIAKEQLTKPVYASGLLIKTIERDNYRNLKNFDRFSRLIDNVTHNELE